MNPPFYEYEPLSQLFESQSETIKNKFFPILETLQSILNFGNYLIDGINGKTNLEMWYRLILEAILSWKRTHLGESFSKVLDQARQPAGQYDNLPLAGD